MNIKNGIQKVYKEYVMTKIWIQSVAGFGKAERQCVWLNTKITIPLHSRRKIYLSQTSN